MNRPDSLTVPATRDDQTPIKTCRQRAQGRQHNPHPQALFGVPSLHSVYRTGRRTLWQGGEFFHSLLQRPEGLVPLPGKKSYLTSRQVTQLVNAGVFAKKKWCDERVCNVVKAFTVPKASGKRRLVVDASNVGEAQKDPPHAELVSISQIKDLVANYNWVVQLDGKSWFYQVPAASLRSFFAVRPVLGIHWLMVLPMGWSWSVWVAQTAVAIGQRAEQLLQQQDDGWQTHLEYIDNFIAVGRNNDDASKMTQAMKKAARVRCCAETYS